MVGVEMFYSVDVDASREIVVTTWGHVCSDESLINYQKSVWTRPDVRGFDELIDFRSVTEVLVTTAGLRKLASLSAGMDSQERTHFAIIADEPLSFGLARMYEAYRSLEQQNTTKVCVFREPELAFKWLAGVSAPTSSDTA